MPDRRPPRQGGRRSGALEKAAPARPGVPLTTRRVSLLLALLVLAFFHEVMLEGKTFVSPDTTAPAGFVAMGEKALWQEHTYPLWNPYVFLGMPSFASGAYNPLIYPPDWPLALIQKVVPLPDMLWLVLYYFLGGLFLFLLAREWGATPEGALIGAAAFVFAPNLVAVGSHGHGSQLVDSAYAPLLLWLAARWMRRGGLANLSWLAIAGGFQLLRGHVQICFYTWLAVALYTVVELGLARREPGTLRTALTRAAGIGAAAALAFGIAGFYSLPLRDYARYSIRGGGEGGGVGIEYATAWSLAPYELPEMVVPGWVGFGGATYWGGMPFTDYPNAYLGMIAVLLLIPAGLIRPGAGPAAGSAAAPRLFALLAGLLAVLVAFGSHFPLYRFLYDHLPLFNKFRVPVMILLLLQLAVALGAAWGWSAVVAGGEPRPPRGPRLDRVLLGAAIALGAVLLIGLLARDAWHDAYVRAALAHRGGSLRFNVENFGPNQAAMAWQECWSGFLRACLLGLLAVGTAWLARGGRLRLAATAGLLALLLFELWPVSARVMTPVIGEPPPKSQQPGRDDTIDFLLGAGPPGSFRIVPFDEFQSNRFATFGIASVGGYHAAKPQLIQDFLDRHLQGNPYWMRVLNVRYVVVQQPYEHVPDVLRLAHEGAAQVFEYLPALPRATVVGSYRVLTPATAILDSVETGHVDLASLTFLEKDPGLTLGPVTGAHATIDRYRLNDVTVTVESPGPALLRLADLWYPDWVATVDGRPAEVLKADYLLRAVAVPAGRHRVEFHFRSRAVRNGLVLSLVSLLVALAGLGAARWPRRPAAIGREGPPSPPPPSPAAPGREG